MKNFLVSMAVALALLSTGVKGEAAHIPGIRYVQMDTTDPAYAGLITAANALQQSTSPGSILSIRLSNDGLEAIVKILSTNPGWRTAHLSGPVIIRVEGSNDYVIDLIFNNSNWMEDQLQ